MIDIKQQQPPAHTIRVSDSSKPNPIRIFQKLRQNWQSENSADYSVHIKGITDEPSKIVVKELDKKLSLALKEERREVVVYNP